MKNLIRSLILIMVMANPVFAAERMPVEELKTAADKFAACSGVYSAYATHIQTTEPRRVTLVKLLNGQVDNLRHLARDMLLLAYRKTPRFEVSMAMEEDAVRQISRYVSQVSHVESMHTQVFLEEENIKVVEELRRDCDKNSFAMLEHQESLPQKNISKLLYGSTQE